MRFDFRIWVNLVFDDDDYFLEIDEVVFISVFKLVKKIYEFVIRLFLKKIREEFSDFSDDGEVFVFV